MSSSTGEGNGAGANLGSPIAPKFQVQPRLRLFQAESQGVLGLIEWLFRIRHPGRFLSFHAVHGMRVPSYCARCRDQ